MYDAYEWMQLLGLGGLIGALGQGARAIIGIKKLSATASQQGQDTADLISPSRLAVSMAIGFIAGALAATGIFKSLKDIPLDQILAVAAAGYAGADFIEGFMNWNGKPQPTSSPAGRANPADADFAG